MTKQEVKDTIIEMFKDGDLKLSLSTTVSESGEGVISEIELWAGEELIDKTYDYLTFPSQNSY